MSKHRILSLTHEQREHLDKLIRSGNAPARVQTRARILLHTDRSQADECPDPQVAQAVRVNPATVVRTRKAFLEEGMDAAPFDKPRPGPSPRSPATSKPSSSRWPAATRPQAAVAGRFGCWPIRWWSWATSRASATKPSGSG